MSEDSHDDDPLGPAAQDQRDDGADYEIGYGKPPSHGTWKKGQSGNPRGAPKQVVNLVTSFNAMLQETDVTVKGGRVVSKSEGFARQLINSAIKCDQKAFAKFLQLAKRAGMLEPPPPDRQPVRSARAGFVDLDVFKAEFGKPLPKA
jgi:hypothetical protein